MGATRISEQHPSGADDQRWPCRSRDGSVGPGGQSRSSSDDSISNLYHHFHAWPSTGPNVWSSNKSVFSTIPSMPGGVPGSHSLGSGEDSGDK